jgi:hypothetical protein
VTLKLTTEAEVLAIARAAGLDKAIEQFRDDVIGAAASAAHARSAYSAPTDPAVEPWPPMRTGGGV